METPALPSARQLESLLSDTNDELTRFRDEVMNDHATIRQRFDGLKEELKASVREMRLMIQDDKSINRSVAVELESKLDRLEEHLDENSGPDLKATLSKVASGLADLSKQLMTSPKFYKLFPVLFDKIHRYVIKAQILYLKAELGKLAVKKFIHDKKVLAEAKIKRWEDFRKEINKAYAHLHQAFTSK